MMQTHVTFLYPMEAGDYGLMDEIEEFKRFLGPSAKDYRGAQLRQLRYEVREMAALLLDSYLDKRRENTPGRHPVAHFDRSELES